MQHGVRPRPLPGNVHAVVICKAGAACTEPGETALPAHLVRIFLFMFYTLLTLRLRLLFVACLESVSKKQLFQLTGAGF
jgi:hypothetical protein